ncbi:DUF3147 family protein [Streptomyces sp. OM5714]|uniref:DUF3147 family protein n=1 Tax=Streptomyces sp. OM5714 TaxID=2602736 RepID=UPI0013DA917B|nr:DUF3147 family protein [Streptomyces sp. OM5714]KAF2774688.1 molecular chaperone DnaK [Streptomyces sp. OM5714]
MDLAEGTRTTAVAAAVTLLGGLAVIVYGIIRHNLAWSLGGACLTMPVLTLIALVVVRRWIVDTRQERIALSIAQRHAEGQRTRYIALEAALENEHGRLVRDMAAERAQMAARLQAERDAMEAEFEERKATLICETMEATVRMFRGGKFAPETPAKGNLIRFPEKLPAQERSREHGVVGP